MIFLYKGLAKSLRTAALSTGVLAAFMGCTLLPPAPVPEATVSAPAVEISEPEAVSPPPPPARLILTFAGDIMAHRCNYSMTRYDSVYTDVRDYLHEDDLTFGNLEMPVDDSLPQSTYPRFNVHAPYVRAAVDGGFDVLSLANNHSNDQGASSMEATRVTVAGLPGLSLHSGLRTLPGDEMKAVSKVVKGQTVTFLAVTEILNSYDSSRRMVYLVPPRESDRAAFIETVKNFRADNPDGLFVLSVHVNESEYVRTVSDAKEAWFARLAEAGVDIIWAHHPHVMQSWEILETGGRNALVMYSMGNFISGQRWDTDPANPDGYREYTGDALLLRVTAARQPVPETAQTEAKTGFSFAVSTLAVTNWRDPREGMVVRRASEAFFDSLPAAEAQYYRDRWRLMGSYLPVTIPAN